MIRLVLAVAMSAFGLLGSASAAVFPLKIEENGRYLADQRGEPFLVVGDTAWSLIAQLDEGDIDHYLKDRQKRGFNSIIVNLIEHKFCTVPPKTRSGLAPFVTTGDFSTPNPDYFDFAYKVVKKANDRGIVVWLFPAYLGYGGGDEGFFREMKSSGKAALRTYGKFIGKRFRDLPNIVWVLGGDFVPKEADQWTVREVAEGIREEDSSHLMSGHASRGVSAVTAFGDQKWLTINTIYTGEKTLVEPMRMEYERHPTRPFVLIESIYEGEHNSKADQVRRQAYWTMLGGGCGQFFGNNPIWHFDGPGLFPTKTTWKEALEETGSQDMGRLRDLFIGLAWHRLEPEQNHGVITDGYGEGIATALTAITANKRLAVTYVPSTGSESRHLTVNLAQFAGPIIGRWYNPTNGRWTAVSDVPLANRNCHAFRTPGDNGTKTNDWVLVLEVQPSSQRSADKRPTKIWNREGPLVETPKHVTDAYPLSDQENKGGWVKFEPMSDEFEGSEPDHKKWTVGLEWWKGRQPALFSEKNVTVSDGKLHLTMRKEKVPEEFEKLGYKDYTSAALHSKARCGYGYYEVKAKPMNSGGSSSFWFQVEEEPGWLTEIDVFEIGGKAKGFEQKYNMNLHVFKTPQEKKHWSVGGVWVAPWRLADDYHVYGLDWGKDEIKFYVDGVLVRSVENTHWHQPLYLIFDSETMPKWFGMPDDKDLPSTFSVEYVRAWKKQYPQSPVIKELRIEPERQSIGHGDNWPITWADDDAQYTVYCDGKGFGGGSGEGSMSLGKISGSPPRLEAENISSASAHKKGGGEKGRKASGLLMVDGVLYTWVRNLKQDGTGSSLAWSADHAQTWTWADWNFPEIGYPVWLNAGRNYAAAEDEFAYLYWPDTPSAYKTADHILLARVPKSQIPRREAYRFFAGEENDQPRWIASYEDCKPVFTDMGHCYRPEVVYIPGLKRYLLCTATSGAPKWCGTEEKYLGIFDAPTPWGPWTTVKQIKDWGGEENRFQPRIPSKWISEDGRGFYLLYSCFPKGPYQFNIEKCSVEMGKE